MVDSDSVHADSTLRCHAELTDDDGEPIENDHGHPQTCGAELTGEDHATFVRSPRGEDMHGQRLEDRFQQDALRWDCPDCGATMWTCPVCYDDRGGPGWFVGESTGELLACHNCNAQEAARQNRNMRADGGRREGDLPGIPTSMDDVADPVPPHVDRDGGA